MKLEKLKYCLLLFASILLWTGCTDSPQTPTEGPEGRLEGEGETLATIFHIDPAQDGEIVGNVKFHLANPEVKRSFHFDGEISFNPELEIFGRKGVLTCRVDIGNLEIPDGRYLLSLSWGDRQSSVLRMLRFRGNVCNQERYSQYVYADLEGSGTKDAPYLIKSAGDFLSFQYGLMDDEFQGYGQYFRIERGFELPKRSQIIDGREWAAVCFQGSLDGGGHTLRNLAYTGGADVVKDSEVGLFKSLYNADISNLKLTGALITNASSNVGLIAGKAGGHTSVTNVSIEGTIQAAGDGVGGIIGWATEDITLSGITVNTLSITANDEAGLLIGSIRNGNLNVNNVSTPGHVFTINGKEYVGGVVGLIDRCSEVAITNVALEHSVDAESADVRIISGTGHVGGIVGKATNIENLTIGRCTIKAPVSGGNYASALVGEASSSVLTFDGNLLASVVKGADFTGGFLGKIGLAGNTLTFTGNNRYVVKQSAEAGVDGSGSVGALAGSIEGSGKVDLKSVAELAVNVSGTRPNVGGAVGLLSGAIDFDITNLNFSSPTMRVKGTADGVGGVIGWCNSASIYASNSIDVSKGIPREEKLTSNCGIIVNGASTVGGIVGLVAGGSVKGVVSDAVVTATSITGSDHGCGGIVGSASGSITTCAFLGKVSGPARVGGIAGLLNMGHTVDNCINYSDIDNGHEQGGIVGYMRTSPKQLSHIRFCANDGNLTGGVQVGGIVAEVNCNQINVSSRERTYIESCYNVGDIVASGNADYPVAGIVGRFHDDWACVRYCSNYGDVSSTKVAYAIGGVVGDIGDTHYDNRTTVYECLNDGAISCDVASTKLGGIVGHIHQGGTHVGTTNSTIHDCLNMGSIPSDQKNDTGGIVGMVATATDTYRTFNSGKISHGNATVGTHKSGTIFYHDHNYYLEGTGKSWPSSTSVKSDKLTDKSVYKEFDFEKIWEMTQNGPRLRNAALR